ncbi:hypothetical protein CUR21_13085 [Pseudorhodobacter sp. MZDSW-24AT]|nr:hypothetical protein CUR21_13085 [Pseudorhodobacter sp. MZDSW-24AT]
MCSKQAVQRGWPDLPPDLRERTFDRFRHGDEDQELGRGFRLALVKNVAAAHDGAARRLHGPRGLTVAPPCSPFSFDQGDDRCLGRHPRQKALAPLHPSEISAA